MKKIRYYIVTDKGKAKQKGYIIDFKPTLAISKECWRTYVITDLITGRLLNKYYAKSYQRAIEKFKYDFENGLKEALDNYRKTHTYLILSEAFKTLPKLEEA